MPSKSLFFFERAVEGPDGSRGLWSRDPPGLGKARPYGLEGDGGDEQGGQRGAQGGRKCLLGRRLNRGMQLASLPH